MEKAAASTATVILKTPSSQRHTAKCATKMTQTAAIASSSSFDKTFNIEILYNVCK